MSNKDRIGWVLIGLAVFLLAKGGGGLPSFTPAPIDVPGLHVLIVEEKEDRATVPTGQQSVLKSSLISQHVINEKKAEFRQYDDDPTITEEPWKSAMARPRTSLPWIIVSNPGKGGFEGPLPGSIDETLALIGRFE